MGIIKQGILGGFSGIVGTVVGGNWRGVDYMRSRPTKRKASNSPAQLEQRAKFLVAQQFVQSMKPLLETGFRGQAIKMTEINTALSYTLKNAVTGTYPDYSIVYSQVLVTRGSLPNAMAPAATAGDAGVVHFNWSDNSGIGKARGTDKAILVAWCRELNQTVYIISPARSAESADLQVPAFSGKTVQTWISFTTEKGNEMASSIFTGEVTVL